MNDGTGTEPHWIASLTDDYRAPMCVRMRGQSPGGQRGTPRHSFVNLV